MVQKINHYLRHSKATDKNIADDKLMTWLITNDYLKIMDALDSCVVRPPRLSSQHNQAALAQLDKARCADVAKYYVTVKNVRTYTLNGPTATPLQYRHHIQRKPTVSKKILAQGDNQIICLTYKSPSRLDNDSYEQKTKSIKLNVKTIMQSIKNGACKLDLLIKADET
ncbi:hypothetical protein A3Q56_06911 [Intoshia linei]|uniref:RdRp catalytic domain-containing protein n=1 Tax=Intoshia linei TaxID=1819745 RepID=A0A177ATP4_9BILA|nr:hypothetical protein A3Q56_06911 [Intoshia linei]